MVVDPAHALMAGAVAGLAIATQVGPVTVLVVEAAATSGRRAGCAAGMGVATADLGFAALAATTAGIASGVLTSHRDQIQMAGAAVLAAIALYGLFGLARGAHSRDPERDREGPSELGRYGRFVAITAANPLTIVSFAAIVGALSVRGAPAAAAFAVGVGVASAAWHLVLATTAGGLGHRLTSRGRVVMGVAGRLAVLAIAASLALGAT